MATNYMRNPGVTNAFTDSTDAWSAYTGGGTGTATLTRTVDGGRFVTSAANGLAYLTSLWGGTNGITGGIQAPYGSKFTMGNVAIRRNTAASATPDRIELTVNAGSDPNKVTTSISLKDASFPVGVWVTVPGLDNPKAFMDAGFNLNYNRAIIYASGMGAMDITVKGFNCYITTAYDADYAPVVIDTSDASFAATVAENSLVTTFSHSANNELVNTLKWDWGDGTTNTYAAHLGRTPSHTYPKAGIYTVTCTATNNQGQTASTGQSLSVPTGAFTANYAYQANYLTLDVDGSNSVAPTTDPVSVYTWNWGDGTANSTGKTATHVYAAPATYNVTLTTTTTGTKRTSTSVKSIAVTSPPNPENYFTVIENFLSVTFSPSITAAGSTYLWNFGDGNTDTAQSPEHTYDVPGSYAVTLTVNGTLTTTQTISVTDTYTPIKSPGSALRLEVAVPYPVGALYNRLHNPNGELGAYGWATPVVGSSIVGSTTATTAVDKGVAGAKLVYRSSGTGAQTFTTESVRVVAGQYTAAQFISPFTDGYVRASVEALNASGTVLGTSAVTGYFQGSLTLTRRTTPYLLPAGTTAARVKYFHTSDTTTGVPSVGKIIQLRRVMLATAATSAALTSLPYAEYENWVDVIGPTSDISFQREALNVGSFNATVRDANLDPAVSDTIQAGQSVRLRVNTMDNQGNSVWESLYTGTLTNAQTTYEKDFTNNPKKTRITLSAVDNITLLATAKDPRGVASIVDLPELLEGVAVPYEINGASGQVGTVQTVAVNDNASVLDQIAITRDNNRGYAFVDRNNVLIARDPESMPTVPAGLIDETAYSNVDAEFSTSGCINSITVRWQRMDSASGETTEILYGPYEDSASIDKYGLHATEVVFQGGVESPTAIAAKANAILATSAVPVRHINSVTIPIRYVEDLNSTKALLDLYDLVRLKYARIDGDELARITGISHTITPQRWDMELSFSVDGAVAPPQVVPSPSFAPGGLTELGGGIDLNTQTSTGTYTQTANAEAASGSNYPAPVAGLLEVASSDGGTMVWQRYTAYKDRGNTTYTRNYYAGAWSAWLNVNSGPKVASVVAATAALTATTTVTDVPGMSVTFTSAESATFLVNAILDFQETANVVGGYGVGTVWLDGVAQSAQIIFGGQRARATSAQQYVITGLAAGSHTIKVRLALSGTGGTYRTNPQHSTLSVVQL